MKRLRLADAPDVLSIKQAAAILGVSADLLYNAAAGGSLPVLRLGRRLLVPRAALEHLLERPSEVRRGDAQG
jgi:excisionase family DNA binding protein